MDSKAQAGTEYLLAIVLSFFITLVILGSMVGFAGSSKETLKQINGNWTLEKQEVVAKNPITMNVLLFTVTLVIFYFVESFFVVLFLRYVTTPEKKKPQRKSSNY